MLRDERGGPGIGGKPRNAARPYGMAYRDWRVDEVDDDAGVGVNGWRSVLFDPAVVVLGNRVKNRVPTRPRRERDAVLHTPSRKMRVVGLRDQL